MDPVDHLAEADLARHFHSPLIIVRHTSHIPIEQHKIALCIADEETVRFDTSYSSTPESLEMARDFGKTVRKTIFATFIFNE